MPATATDRIDGLTTSVAIKAPCVVYSTSNITLSGLQTVNGVTVAEGDRVLVKAQTNSVDNGIYMASTSAWVRARDFDGARDVVRGTLCPAYTSSGTEEVYRVTTANPVTIGSSAITFAQSILVSGDASAITFLQSGTGATSRTVQDKLRDGWAVSIKDFGAVCDGVTDDTVAFQAAVDAMGSTAVSQRSGMVLLVPGPTLISSTITARRKSFILHGLGWGYRGDTGARNSYILWNGAAGSPMLKVQDVNGFAVKNIAFFGKSTAKPSSAIEFNETNDGWPITSCVLDTVLIGSQSGDTDSASPQFTNGITLGGSGLNNSEHLWTNVKIHLVSQDGVHVGSIQNVNIHIRGLFASNCLRAALYNCGQVRGENWSLANNAVDIYSPATDDNASTVVSSTTVTSLFSESAGRLAEFVGSGDMEINGGSFSISSTLNADGKVIKAEGAATNAVVLRNYTIGQASAPPAAAFLSLPTGAAGHRHVVIDNVVGWANLTGGTNGMSVLTTNPGRAYVDFRENPRTTGLGYPSRVARNFLGGTGMEWNINRFDVFNNTAPAFLDDFLGDSMDGRWGSHVGTDGACVAPTIVTGIANGVTRLTTGADVGGTMALNGSQLDFQVNWTANQGPVVFECRVKMSAITNVAVYVGFTDQVAALEMPFTLAAGDVLTSNATDGAGWLFDTGADTDNWWLVGVANNVDATKQNTAIAPVAATYEVLRVSLEGAVATFSRNGVVVGTAMSGAVSGAFITPVVAAFSRSNASRTIDVDYVLVQSSRNFP